MNRREFLHTTAFGLAAAALAPAQEYDRDKRRRVGLIGCGWYGKSDLFRLVQISPVEIVSLCDVDSQMLSNAAEMSAARQRSKKRPRTYSDCRKMLAEKDLIASWYTVMVQCTTPFTDVFGRATWCYGTT